MLTQPELIDSILEDLHMKENTKTKMNPACSTKLLHKDSEGEGPRTRFQLLQCERQIEFS